MLFALAAAALAFGPMSARAQAQPNVINRALEVEQAGRWRDALAAWRSVIEAGDLVQGPLGLERVFAQLGQEDSLRVVVDSLLVAHPASRVLRAIQLRTLRSLGSDREEMAAFEAWVAAAPNDVAPYKEYAGQLLSDLRTSLADSVLRMGINALGGNGFKLELAQIQIARGQWGAGAATWRELIRSEQYLHQAAFYSLGNAPASSRDSIRTALAQEPATAGARKVHGRLELDWGNPREGWRVLSTLTVGDSALDAWSEFAGEAERQGAWIPARDALLRIAEAAPQVSILLRAAEAASTGGEPQSALSILANARAYATTAMIARQILPLEVRALTLLGKAADAEALVAREAGRADEATRRGFAKQIAWGWVRAGEVEKARRALAGASADDDEEVSGWIALFEGDFVRARAGLRRPADATPDVVTAMAMLGRTKADSGRAAGEAFLALARGDSAAAAKQFELAADELTDATPLLLAFAARIWSQRKADAAAIGLWERVVQYYPLSPEAAESDLEWARTLRRKGDVTGATTRLEHLILSYPQSALVPQARRELEIIRSGIA
ncbi:MAG: hypothetical protein O2973_06010 [Gemmatimonadetes bacterium]|nr:hypothetical protein [Gemmatimonadota bacterium]